MANWWEGVGETFGDSSSESTTEKSSGNWWDIETGPTEDNQWLSPEVKTEIPEKTEEDSTGNWWDIQSGPGKSNSDTFKDAEVMPYDPMEPAKFENMPYNPEEKDETQELSFWEKTKKFAKGALSNTTISLAKSAIGLGEATVGVADMLTKGYAGKLLENVGYDPKVTHDFLAEFYTEGQQEAFKRVEEAEGFTGTVKALAKNPSVVVQRFAESSLSMVAGAAGGGAALAKYGLKYGPVVAGALGEAVLGMGSAAESVRQQTESGTLSAKQMGTSLASGVGTGIFGLVGGRLAKKLGIDDLDTFFAGGTNNLVKGVPGVGPVRNAAQAVARIAGAGITEGAFEEVPQSIQETIWMNAALGKPLFEGVPEGAAEGLMVGAAGGSGLNLVTSLGRTKEEAKDDEEDGKKLFNAKVDASQTPLEEKVVRAEDLTDNPGTVVALEQGKPLFTLEEGGNFVRHEYDANGNPMGTTDVTRARDRLVKSAQRKAAEVAAQTGEDVETPRISIGQLMFEADAMIEEGIEINEMVDRITELSKQPITKSAKESAEVFAQYQIQPKKSAEESAQVLGQAPVLAKPFQGLGPQATMDKLPSVVVPPVKSAEESAQVLAEAPLVTQPFEGKGPQATAEKLGGVALPPMKSAEESAQVLAQAPVVSQPFEGRGPQATTEALDGIMVEPTKDAEESAQVLAQAPVVTKPFQGRGAQATVEALDGTMIQDVKSAEESYLVFAKANMVEGTREAGGQALPSPAVTTGKSAAESAQVFLAEEPKPTQRNKYETLGRPSNAREAAEVLARIAPQDQKSASESAQVFLAEEETINRIERELDEKNVNVQEKIDQIVETQRQTMSAEESAGIFNQSRQAFLANLDDAQRTLNEGRRAEAIAELKRAVARKGKNAEKSAQYFITPEVRRIDKAKAEFAAALAKNDQRGMDEAARNMSEAFAALEKMEGPVSTTETTQEAPKQEQQKTGRRIIVTSDTANYFDTESGTPTIAVASPEDVMIAEEEDVEVETLEDITPQRGRKTVDVPIQRAVEGKAAQNLVQAIINDDARGVEVALQRFPVSRRQGAYQQASKDAMEISRTSGVYDINQVEQSIETHKELSSQRKDGQPYGAVTLKPVKDVPGVWTAKNHATGKEYNIYTHQGKYIVQDENKNITEFDSKEEAAESLATEEDLPYYVVNTGVKGQNQFEVHGPDGLVPTGKRSGGRGYKTEKNANAKRNQLNKVAETEKTKTAKKVKYSEKAKDYAEGKAKKPTSSKTVEKAPRKSVAKRSVKTGTKGSISQTRAGIAKYRASAIEGAKAYLKKLYALPEDITLKELVKELDVSNWSMDLDSSIAYFEERIKIHERALKNFQTTVTKLEDLSLPSEVPGEPVSVSTLRTKGAKAFIKEVGGKSLSDTYDLLEAILPEGVLEGVKVVVVPGKSSSGMPGYFNTRENHVVIFTHGRNGKAFDPRSVASTLLHEIVHGITYESLQYNPDVASDLDVLRDQVARAVLSPVAYQLYAEYEGKAFEFNKWQADMRLQGIDTGIADNAEGRMIYALLSNDEFLANATHPVIKAQLRKVAGVEQTTKWTDKVKKAIKKLFGFQDKEFTAFDRVMSAIGELNAEIEFQGIYEEVSEKLSDYEEVEKDIVSEMGKPMDPNKDVAWLKELEAKERKKLEEEIKDLPDSEKETKRSWFKEKVSDPIETFKDVAVGINERLHAIHPRLAFRLRQAETNILRYNKIGQKALSSFKHGLEVEMKKAKLTDAQKDRVYLALLNGERDIINSIVKRNKRLMKSFAHLEIVRAKIEQSLIDVGALREDQLIKGYVWHREVADYSALARAMARDAEVARAKKHDRTIDPKKWDLDDVEIEIQAAMPQLKKKYGMTTEEARVFVLERIMRTGQYPAVMRVAKGTKERRFPKVPAKYYQYYKNPFESMANHIEESNEVIAMREFLGTTPFTKQLKKLKSLNKKYAEAKPEQRAEILDDIVRLERAIERSEDALHDGIAQFVDTAIADGQITEDQRATVVKLIKGRVTQFGIKNRTLQALRNVGLAVTLGHVTNTLTQAKDGGLVIYRHGIFRTAQAMTKTILGMNKISAKDFDMQRIMNEFRSTKGWNLQKVFRRTGFTALDNFMKTVNLQAHVNTLMSKSKSPKGRAYLHNKYDVPWGRDFVDLVIADLQKGIVSPDVQTAAITEMSKDVPIFLSEMPYAYNQGGNARLMYTLKSYAIKIMNIAMRDGIKKITHGKGFERLEGVKNLVALSLILAMVGGGVEELKDLLVGKETDFWDNASDEIFQIFMLNRYTLGRVQKQGPSAFVEGLLSIPALNIADAGWKFFSEGSMEGIKYVPFPGVKEAYFNFAPSGREKVLKYNREQIFGRMRREVQNTGKISGTLRRKVRDYNKAIKGTSLKPITFNTIKQNRQRYLQEKDKIKLTPLKVLGLAPAAIVGLGMEMFSKEKVEQKNENYDKQLVSIIDKAAKRVGVSPVDARKNMSKFISTVAYAESRGRLDAKNPKSTATGLYQFLDGSIEPAVRRTERIVGKQPWMLELLKTKDMTKLNWHQQTLLFLGDITEKTAVVNGKQIPFLGDKLLKEIMMNGNKEAMRQAYMILHHTKPDEATEKNWYKAIDKVLG